MALDSLNWLPDGNNRSVTARYQMHIYVTPHICDQYIFVLMSFSTNILYIYIFFFFFFMLLSYSAQRYQQEINLTSLSMSLLLSLIP